MPEDRKKREAEEFEGSGFDGTAFEDIYSESSGAEKAGEDPCEDLFSGSKEPENESSREGWPEQEAPGSPKGAEGREPGEKGSKKRKRTVLKILAAFLALLLLLAAGAGIYIYKWLRNFEHSGSSPNPPTDENTTRRREDRLTRILNSIKNQPPLAENKYIDAASLARDDAIRNILLIGVDAAQKGEDPDRTRSDTIILFSIDAAHRQLKLTSILRDSYVVLPHTKKLNKLNAAHSQGGNQLLVDTIEYNFKVDVDNYMLVDFKMFTAIVDELGGVDVELTKKEAKYLNRFARKSVSARRDFPQEITAGPNHLTGAQALHYCRIRHMDSDFYRTARQRRVLSALLTKVRRASLAELYRLAERVLPMVQTDLTRKDIVDIAKNGFSYMRYDFVQMQVPVNGTWHDERVQGAGAVLTMDIKKNAQLLKDFIYGGDEETSSQKTGKQ